MSYSEKISNLDPHWSKGFEGKIKVSLFGSSDLILAPLQCAKVSTWSEPPQRNSSALPEWIGLVHTSSAKGQLKWQKTGTLCRVSWAKGAGKVAPTATFVGLCRFRLRSQPGNHVWSEGVIEASPLKRARKTPHFLALEKNGIQLIRQLSRSHPEIPEDQKSHLLNESDSAQLCYLIMPWLTLTPKERLAVLQSPSSRSLIRHIITFIKRESSLLKISDDIRKNASKELSLQEKRAYLRSQLNQIRSHLLELGDTREALADEGEESWESSDESDQWEEHIEELELPHLVRKAAQEEVEKLRFSPPGSSDYLVSYSYLKLLTALPWESQPPKSPTIAQAEKTLNKNHAGLDAVKKRVLEYIAVLRHTQKVPGQILLLEGPPGVGKTSLAKSIAKALSRPFAKVALGGVHDEAEIRGHRRTYIGSMPGKILQAIKQAGTQYPVILLDEIDKMGRGGELDLAPALLEVLDPEQNREFVDHFLAVPFDLSKVLFIGTANNSQNISSALLDRMEVIGLTSYSEQEKLFIAKKHIVPEIRAELDLRATQMRFDDDAIVTLIRNYTLEGGVRQLRREIATIARKLIRQIVERKFGIKSRIQAKDLPGWLGPAKYHTGEDLAHLPAGVAIGLAYTETGGDLLLIETNMVPAGRFKEKASQPRPELKLTGSLGHVLQESAFAAMTILTNQPGRFNIDLDALYGQLIHIHLPDGGTPKDGPSAGLAIFIALCSLASSRRITQGMAFTGEVTLRGKILPVGGVKEKILAALRYGCTSVVIPEDNLSDLKHLDPTEWQGLKIFAASHLMEVMDIAFRDPPSLCN